MEIFRCHCISCLRFNFNISGNILPFVETGYCILLFGGVTTARGRRCIIL